MPRDSQGQYSLPNGTLVSEGETIQVSQHNPPFQDVAAALTGSLARNGTGGMLSNLNNNGFRITNLGNPTAGGDAISRDYLDSRFDAFYEENTFNPVIQFGGFNVTYAEQTGYWTRVGRLVTVHCRCQWTNISGSLNGEFRISGGLPIHSGDSGIVSVGSVVLSGFGSTIAGPEYFNVAIRPEQNSFLFIGTTAFGSSLILQGSNVPNSGSVSFTITYPV